MSENSQQLLDLLVERGLIDQQQLQHIQGRALQEGLWPIDIIREERLVFPEALAQVLAEVVGVPYIDLSKVKIDGEAMRDISRKAALTYRFAPFDIQGNKLLVAMETIDDAQSLEAIRFVARRRNLVPELYLASPEGINEVLGSGAGGNKTGQALKEFSHELEQAGDTDHTGNEDITRVVEEAPVTKIVAVIIRHAIEGSATDIHIEPTGKQLRVRYRIGSKLHTTLLLPMKVHEPVVSRIKVLSALRIESGSVPQSGRFTATIEQRTFDLQITTLPTVYGEKVTLRIIDTSAGIPSLEELGLSGTQLNVYREAIDGSRGIILFAGPSGVGKSTTVHSSLTALNTEQVSIATVEDPVEYEIDGISQTQVRPETGLQYPIALQGALRQNPDIVFVGNTRDEQTARLVVQTAMDGAQVFTTVQARDALSALSVLQHLGVEHFLLTSSIRLLVSQRLVATVCEHCVKEEPLTASMEELIEQELEHVPEEYKPEKNQRVPEVVYRSEGCAACHEGGMIARTGIFEVIPMSRKIRAAINDRAEYGILQDIAVSEGHITMRQSGLLKALVGAVQLEDVLRVTERTS